MLTLFIYTPWFVCKMMNYFASKTTLGPTRRGVVSFAFTGTGGGLFKLYFVNAILTALTIGIYAPWALCNVARFFTQNVQARTDDGTHYQARFDGTGGGLFWRFFGGYWLLFLTLFIYTPWFICGLQRFFAGNTKLLENGHEVGSLQFVGEATTLLGTFIVGYLLMIVTVGIYVFWFQISMLKFFATNTKITWQGRTFAGDFDGSGAEFFGTAFVGYLLTMVTIGVYGCWFITNLVKFHLTHQTFREIGGAAPATAAFAPPQAYG